MSKPTEVRERRDPVRSDILDPDSLDPKMRYAWVQSRQENVTSKLSRGMKFVRRGSGKDGGDGVKTLFEQDDDKGDGLIRHGDRILMCEPKARYEERARGHLALSEARLRATDRKVRELAANNKVKLHEGDD